MRPSRRLSRWRSGVGAAIKVGRIAIGEIEEKKDDGKDPNAKALGARGGEARARKLPPPSGKEIAKKAAEKRWKT
jgi:hypothetical protein